MINQHQFEQSARHFRSGRISLHEFAARVFHGAETTPHHLNPSAPSKSKKSSQPNVGSDLPNRPRVLLGEGQPAARLAEMVSESQTGGQPVLITRISAEVGQALAEQFPQGNFSEADRTFALGTFPKPKTYAGPLTVVADTEESPIAAEAYATLKWLGATVNRTDATALESNLEMLKASAAIVVVGGAESSLPVVVAQAVDCDVFAVPTSTDAAANPQSIEKLLAVANGNSHVALVGIDAGYTAGYLAASAARPGG